MTETEWLACRYPNPMLDSLQEDLSDRKLRLFACACCRHIWHLLGREARDAVQVAERFADGMVGSDHLAAAFATLWPSVRRDLTRFPWDIWVRRSAGVMAAAAATATATVAPESAKWRQWWCSLADGNVPPWDHAARALAQEALPETSRDEALIEEFEALSRIHEEVLEQAYWYQADLLRDIAGNPFRTVVVDDAWLRWRDGTVTKIAQSIYDSRRFKEMLILADALEEAGCTDAELLGHCRQPQELWGRKIVRSSPERPCVHVRGCWVLDLLLEKARTLRLTGVES
jgi:hypothetical protein